jgi:dienelactone hydrolase
MRVISAVVCALTGSLLLSSSPAQGQASLPQPTGDYGIGRCVLDWTDSTRPETQSDQADGRRELLVYLFYPTDRGAPGLPAEYFPHLKEVEAFEERFGKNFFRESYGISYKTIVTLRSHAVENSVPAKGTGQFPVVIFSHGGGIPVLYYTAIIENLVSHGYVVAAVEHTFDGATVVFPDGRIVTQSGWDEDSKRTPQERAAFHAARHRVGAQDNRFVLDQLERANAEGLPGVPPGLRGRLKTERAGAVGHSLGGMISVVCGREDKRFRICLNLDGGLDAGLTYGALTVPVVAMYGDNRKPRQQGETAEKFAKRRASRDRFVEGLKAPYKDAPNRSYLLLVDSPAFSHFSYYDLPNSQADDPVWRATPEQWMRNQRIILDCTLAVLDAHLKLKEPRPIGELLKQIPEVKVEPIGASESHQ